MRQALIATAPKLQSVREGRRPLATFFVGLLALSVTCAHAAPERAHKIYNFDIERTTRNMALNLLGKQADELMVGYLSSNSAEELMLVGPVKGPHTIEDAVRVIVFCKDADSSYG